jgi:hypothetical protein
LDFFVDPYAEVDGQPHRAVDRRVTFRDGARPSSVSVPKSRAPN